VWHIVQSYQNLEAQIGKNQCETLIFSALTLQQNSMPEKQRCGSESEFEIIRIFVEESESEIKMRIRIRIQPLYILSEST
jgi:hypothetical protein